MDNNTVDRTLECVVPMKLFMETFMRRSIEKVIFSGPATIVFWNDGTKTVVKCQQGDDYDRHMGLAMACAKKLLGNTGSYYEVFKKWIPGAYQDVQPAQKATKEEWEESGKYLKGEEILVQSAQTDSKSVREIVQSAQKEEMSPLAEKIGGVPDKADQPIRSRIDHGKIVALYTATPPRSISWIAEDLGCSKQTVINHLKKEGLYGKE